MKQPTLDKAADGLGQESVVEYPRGMGLMPTDSFKAIDVDKFRKPK